MDYKYSIKMDCNSKGITLIRISHIDIFKKRHIKIMCLYRLLTSTCCCHNFCSKIIAFLFNSFAELIPGKASDGDIFPNLGDAFCDKLGNSFIGIFDERLLQQTNLFIIFFHAAVNPRHAAECGS